MSAGILDEVRGFLKGLPAELPELFKKPPVPKTVKEPARERREQARSIFERRTAHFAAAMGVTFGRIAIKDQKSLWGSCSRAGNLNFNWRLVLAPPEVLDYLVVHELAHLIEMNHSRRFWEHVRRHSPDYKAHRRWLRDNADALKRA